MPKADGTVTMTLESYNDLMSELQGYRGAAKLYKSWNNNPEIEVDLTPWKEQISDEFYEGPDKFSESFLPLDFNKRPKVNSYNLFKEMPEEMKAELDEVANTELKFTIEEKGENT